MVQAHKLFNVISKRLQAVVLTGGLVTLPLGSGLAAAEPPGVEPVPYSWGTVTLQQRQVPPQFATMPVPLTGTLALPPEGEGPWPTVLVLHGRHGGCHYATPPQASQWPCEAGQETRYDTGFTYLMGPLAAAGYAVVAPNLNGAYTYAFGATPQNQNELVDQRTPQLLAAHLHHLAAAHGGAPLPLGSPPQEAATWQRLQGQLDLGRMAAVGHSLGGGAAVLSGLTGVGQFAGLLLVAPTRSHPLPARADTFRLPDIPTAVLMGGCDRDIFDLSSAYFLEAAADRQTPVAALLVWGANHNYYSRAVAADDYLRQPDAPALCGPDSPLRLSRSQQETLLIRYSRQFLAALFDHRLETVPGFAAHRSPPSTLAGVPVTTALSVPVPQRRPLAVATPTGLQAAPDVTLQASPHLEQVVCPAFQPCPPRPQRRPAFPSVVHLQPTVAETWLALSLNGAAADVSQFEALHVRLGGAVPRQTGTNQPTAGIGVVLRDRQGRSARVDVPFSAMGLPSLPAGSSDALWHYPGSIRIPLSQFGNVNRQQLAQVELWPGPTPIDVQTVEWVAR